jgi:hypothetical protein
LSEAVDVRTLQRIVEKLGAVTARAHYEEEDGRYWIDAEDWRELRELLASSIQQVEKGVRKPGHVFGPSGRCSGCGMTERYYKGAMVILQGWPEDSEKEERMAELATCKNDLNRVQGQM